MENYKIENLQLPDKYSCDESPQMIIPPNYNELFDKIKVLKSNSSINIRDALKFIKRTFFKNQDDVLLGIFEEANLFDMVIKFVSSKNQDLSIEALSFIIDFTSNNEDFAQLFVENKLFYILSDIIRGFCAKSANDNDEQNHNTENTANEENFLFLNLALSIISNLSKLNCLYVKRIWRMLGSNTFFAIIKYGNNESLKKCAKIFLHSIQNSNSKSISNLAIEGIFRLLHCQDFEMLELALYGIVAYFDDINQSAYELDIFSKFPFQQLLENFYSYSNSYSNVIRIRSLKITGQMIIHKIISEFRSQTLLPLLQDNNNAQIQKLAFWCLEMSIVHFKIVDKRIFLDFLMQNGYVNLLQCSFDNIPVASKAIIEFLEKLDLNDFMAVMNDVMIMVLIRFIQLEVMQKRIMNLLLKFELKKEIIEKFSQLGGNDILDSIEKSTVDNNLKKMVADFQNKYHVF